MQKIIKERRLIIFVFLASMGLLFAIAVSNYFTTRRFIEVSDRARIVNAELKEMDDLTFLLVSAETRQRGYIITGKEYNLSLYIKRRDSVFHKMAVIKNLIQNDSGTANIFATLEGLIERRIYKLDNVIKVRDQFGLLEASKFIETDYDIMLKDSIRTLLFNIRTLESERYNLAEARAKKSGEWTIINTIIGYSLAIIFLISIFATLIKEVTTRIRSEKEAYKYAEQINDLYNKAPIGYYSLDSEGTIVNINDTQLNWLGYNKDELVNKKKFADMLDPDSIAKFNDCFTVLKRGEEVADIELNIFKKSGYILPVIWNSTGVLNEKGDFLMSRSVLFDNTELSRNKQNLEAVNNELQSFAYSVSHDLRAPLRHINGFIDLLRQKLGEKLDEQSSRYLNIIYEASRKMGILIDELLAFSRMSRQEFLKSKTDLNKVLAEAVQTIKEYNSDRKIDWIIGSLPEIECDPAMMRIVFDNLLSNAAKFTSKNDAPRVEVGSYEKNGHAVIYVKDNGAGFDTQYSSNLFGVFQRLHRQDEFEGNGIGLATARRIINRHGGTMWAESELGKGASFYFSLPN